MLERVGLFVLCFFILCLYFAGFLPYDLLKPDHIINISEQLMIFRTFLKSLFYWLILPAGVITIIHASERLMEWLAKYSNKRPYFFLDFIILLTTYFVIIMFLSGFVFPAMIFAVNLNPTRMLVLTYLIAILFFIVRLSKKTNHKSIEHIIYGAFFGAYIIGILNLVPGENPFLLIINEVPGLTARILFISYFAATIDYILLECFKLQNKLGKLHM